jgi:fermentation-respiration switch protein FrsA (DUF1100 family)
LLCWVGAGVICYVGVTLVLLALENRLLFYPIRATEEWAQPPDLHAEDVFLHTADGTRVHAWWCPLDGWQPGQGAVLYCHGNAGNLSHRATSVKRWLRELDKPVLIFDYPGYGRSDGSPNEAGCYAAGDAAYDWLIETQKVPPEQIILYGGSLGGGVAVELASRRPHRALVLVKTFTSIPECAQSIYPWLPARWLCRNRFDNLQKIAHCTRPVFIAHGTADRLVPFAHGRQLFAAANEPKQFLSMEGMGHNEGLTREFFPALQDFLAAHTGS